MAMVIKWATLPVCKLIRMQLNSQTVPLRSLWLMPVLAATVDTHGWGAAAYSTIGMGGNSLTLGGDVRFVLEIGGAALGTLVATDDASICTTRDAEGLVDGAQYLAGRDITHFYLYF